MNKTELKAFLEGMYYVYNRREIINPDPLYFLYQYENLKDREVVGLIASSLAYGRVAQIMKSTERVLACLGKEPHKFLIDNERFDLVPETFKHRFTTAYDMNNFLRNIASILRENESIEGFMSECLKLSEWNIFSALDKFSERLSMNREPKSFSLITAPKDGSACKRIFLFLRWLVRHDDVDPGGWEVLKPSELIVPMDTHMHQMSQYLGLTERKTADLTSAKEITTAFCDFCPNDPLRYDFSLTRFGIRSISIML